MDAARAKMDRKEFEQISLFEVFPGQHCFVFAAGNHKDTLKLTSMLWGYSSRSLVINARSETALDSSFFHSSQPCIIPCSGYYEWSKDRVKYYFTLEKGTCYLAGLCHKEEDGMHFVILTEQAPLPQGGIHPREPVLFGKKNAADWCHGDNLKGMLGASLAERLMKKV